MFVQWSAIRWLQFLRRPRWFLLTLAALGASVWAGVHVWAWWHFSAGQTALARHQNEAARDHFQQSLRIWPASAPVHLLAARADRRTERWMQAEQHLDECRKNADPKITAEVAFEWALLRAAMGDLASVEQSLQARVVSQPEDAPLIWEALADGYRRTYRLGEALNCLNTWLWFEPANAQAYFLRGEVHRQAGAVARARDEYQKVVELDAGHEAARRHLIRSLVQVGHHQEAAQHLEILLGKYPHDPDLRTILARSQYDLGRREESIQMLDSVLRSHPDFGPALRERSRQALAAEQYAAAEHWLRQTLRVLPSNYEVNWSLHQALQGLGKTAEAKAQLAVAQQLKDRMERVHEIQTHQMSLRPSDPALHAELGEHLIQLGQPETGERWLASALQLNPGLSSAHAAMARLLEEQGDSARAAHHRRKAETVGSPTKN